ncbi:MAG: hypothetical protein SynsKO_41110 [Synoicihabitans sp.]
MNLLRKGFWRGALLISFFGNLSSAQLGQFLEDHFGGVDSPTNQIGTTTSVTEAPTVSDTAVETVAVEIIDVPAPIIQRPTLTEQEIITVGIVGRPPEIAYSLGSSIMTVNGVVALEPARAKIIAPGSTVTLELAEGFGTVSNVNWYHDGTRLASNQNSLRIESFAAEDAGNYHASFEGNADYSTTNTIKLHGAIADQHRLVNQSSRIKISPESPTATFGFVITPPAGGSYYGQSILIRVIGPALADYGVTSPLTDPVYQLRDADGKDVTTGLAFTAVFIDGKSSEQHYRDSVNEASVSVGAFPVESALQWSPAPRNLADIAQLTGGAYTVTVSSESGGTGEVLVEIYEVSNH